MAFRLRSSTLLVSAVLIAFAQERVRPITPPSLEADSAGETRFSFLIYGDNREAAAAAKQDKHARLMDVMLERVEQARGTDSPIRFAIHTGDAVVQGANVGLWNNNFLPIVNRLTAAGVPFYMAPGNHDVSFATSHEAPNRQAALRNTLEAISALIPPDGSPRRLDGYPTYGVGYGNVFVLAFDSNLIGDEKQFEWVKAQLEGLDRTRYQHVFVFCHQQVFSSGPHGAANTEAATMELRTRYIPLFRRHHVDAVVSGHEHFFEHWVERYTDETGPHRMALIVSGGGGAPGYVFRGLPETQAYIDASPENRIQLDQIARPGATPPENPNHFAIVHVDGAKLDLEVVAVDATVPFLPYQGLARVAMK